MSNQYKQCFYSVYQFMNFQDYQKIIETFAFYYRRGCEKF